MWCYLKDLLLALWTLEGVLTMNEADLTLKLRPRILWKREEFGPKKTESCSWRLQDCWVRDEGLQIIISRDLWFYSCRTKLFITIVYDVLLSLKDEKDNFRILYWQGNTTKRPFGASFVCTRFTRDDDFVVSLFSFCLNNSRSVFVQHPWLIVTLESALLADNRKV